MSFGVRGSSDRVHDQAGAWVSTMAVRTRHCRVEAELCSESFSLPSLLLACCCWSTRTRIDWRVSAAMRCCASARQVREQRFREIAACPEVNGRSAEGTTSNPSSVSPNRDPDNMTRRIEVGWSRRPRRITRSQGEPQRSHGEIAGLLFVHSVADVPCELDGVAVEKRLEHHINVTWHESSRRCIHERIMPALARYCQRRSRI